MVHLVPFRGRRVVGCAVQPPHLLLPDVLPDVMSDVLPTATAPLAQAPPPVGNRSSGDAEPLSLPTMTGHAPSEAGHRTPEGVGAWRGGQRSRPPAA